MTLAIALRTNATALRAVLQPGVPLRKSDLLPLLVDLEKHAAQAEREAAAANRATTLRRAA